MKWEYCTLRILSALVLYEGGPTAMELWTCPDGNTIQVEKIPLPKPPAHNILRTLSKLGADGWELTWVETFAPATKSPLIYNLFFKRPVPGHPPSLSNSQFDK